MQTKEEAIRLVQNLIQKYTRLGKEQVSKYNEEMTKKDFLLPLFRALGWNTEDSSEVTAEEKVSQKRVDFSFKLNGITQFFLEAKRLSEDLNNPELIGQAINYAWLKGCAWAVLSNFETIRIFNAEWKVASPFQSHLKTIHYNEFLSRFEELWLLSKESFQNKLLDKEAEKWGKKSTRVSVDKQLFFDFTQFRDILSKTIHKLNAEKQLTELELDESVQRILDRLIFIRNCEDRELEEKILIYTLRKWESSPKQDLFLMLHDVFEYFNENYNSEIFKPHLCDKLKIEDLVLKEIIERLYFAKDNIAFYDFSVIEADVLGNIYEQYLSHILKKNTKKPSLSQSYAHRKEQGIYYTPTYIVDFIVKNTLGEILKTKKKDIEKLRVLDPACGSGSFLIKAFDILNEHYQKYDKDYKQAEFDFKTGLAYTTKVKIVEKHLYGMDIDPQAVEIVRLNLLLKLAEKGKRLPLLGGNIKCGNSLVDDKQIDKERAFLWEEEFSEIMKEGGFDVIIGNPPWVSIKGKHKSVQLSKKKLNYLLNKYPCDRYRPNLFEMFIWRAFSLLKKGGYFAFIVPDRLCANVQFENLRKYILENYTLKALWLRPPFENVMSDNVIFVIQKESCAEEAIVKVAEYPSLEFERIPQRFYTNLSDSAWIFVKKEILEIFDKIKTNPKMFELSQKFKTSVGFIAKQNLVTKTQKSKKQIKVLKGENIQRYQIFGNSFFEFRKENLAGGTQDKDKLSKQQKVFLRKTGESLIATFNDSGIYPEQSLYFLYTDDDKNKTLLLYLTGVLNSKLMNCYYKNFAVTNRDSTPQLKKIDLDKFPIILPNDTKLMIKLVEKMLSLNKELLTLGDKATTERERLEQEIQKTDVKINELVYEIYGLNEKEIQIIEEFQ